MGRAGIVVPDRQLVVRAGPLLEGEEYRVASALATSHFGNFGSGQPTRRVVQYLLAAQCVAPDEERHEGPIR